MTRRQPVLRRLRGRRLRAAAAALLAGLALGVRAAAASGAGEPRILIQDFQFVPPQLVVAAGATVRWVNRDEEIHTVSSDEGLFPAAVLDGEQQFSYRFEKPGTFAVHCALHPQMKGVVVVR